MHALSCRARQRHSGSSVPLTILAMLMGGVAIFFAWQYFYKKQSIVAEVGTTVISDHDVALMMRMHLWRENKQWDALPEQERNDIRQKVLDTLIDEHLANLYSDSEAATITPSLDKASEAAFQQFIKQFESLDNTRQRLEWQQLNEVTLRQQIRQETLHSLALEHFLSSHIQPASGTEIQDWLAVHREQMMLPETAHASHLFLTVHDAEKPSPEAEIRRFYQQITTGQKTLQELATQFTDDPLTKKTKGDLGWFSKDRVSAEFADVVFALKPGEISQPFKTQIGWHVVLLHDKRPARPATVDEASPEITALLQDKKRASDIEQWRVKLREKATVKIHAERLNLIEPVAVH